MTIDHIQFIIINILLLLLELPTVNRVTGIYTKMYICIYTIEN